MIKSIKRIAVTGGAGQIAYNLLFRMASGEMFGKDQPIALHILELPEALKALSGVKMELDDCAFPLLKEVHIGCNPHEVFQGVHYALLVGAKPRGPGMERKDLLLDNAKIFVEQGKALDTVADRNVKVLVVGNPCNTNCLIAMKNAPNIPKQNFFAMTMLDQNRAVAALAEKASVDVVDISHLAIWGNHSSTQVPDFINARIKRVPVIDVIADIKWLENDFIATVQNRGAAIIAARGKSSAASAASAIIDTVQALETPTEPGKWFSCSILSDGNPYGIEKDLIFSFPLSTTHSGDHEIVKNLNLNDFLTVKIKATEKELLEERNQILKYC